MMLEEGAVMAMQTEGSRSASDMETDDVCWICLDDIKDKDTLVSPCRCPRKVHPRCLARWQLQQAGRLEETNCRFCQSNLADWKASLTPDNLKPDVQRVQPIMVVYFEGQIHRIPVKQGPDGLKEFTLRIRELFRLPEDVDISLTFGCKEPLSGQHLKLEGIGAFDAAVHCASVAAAERQQKLKSVGGAPVGGGAAGATAVPGGPLMHVPGGPNGETIGSLADGGEGAAAAADGFSGGGGASEHPDAQQQQHAYHHSLHAQQQHHHHYHHHHERSASAAAAAAAAMSHSSAPPSAPGSDGGADGGPLLHPAASAPAFSNLAGSSSFESTHAPNLRHLSTPSMQQERSFHDCGSSSGDEATGGAGGGGVDDTGGGGGGSGGGGGGGASSSSSSSCGSIGGGAATPPRRRAMGSAQQLLQQQQHAASLSPAVFPPVASLYTPFQANLSAVQGGRYGASTNAGGAAAELAGLPFAPPSAPPLPRAPADQQQQQTTATRLRSRATAPPPLQAPGADDGQQQQQQFGAAALAQSISEPAVASAAASPLPASRPPPIPRSPRDEASPGTPHTPSFHAPYLGSPTSYGSYSPTAYMPYGALGPSARLPPYGAPPLPSLPPSHPVRPASPAGPPASVPPTPRDHYVRYESAGSGAPPHHHHHHHHHHIHPHLAAQQMAAAAAAAAADGHGTPGGLSARRTNTAPVPLPLPRSPLPGAASPTAAGSPTRSPPPLGRHTSLRAAAGDDALARLATIGVGPLTAGMLASPTAAASAAAAAAAAGRGAGGGGDAADAGGGYGASAAAAANRRLRRSSSSSPRSDVDMAVCVPSPASSDDSAAPLGSLTGRLKFSLKAFSRKVARSLSFQRGGGGATATAASAPACITANVSSSGLLPSVAEAGPGACGPQYGGGEGDGSEAEGEEVDGGAAVAPAGDGVAAR